MAPPPTSLSTPPAPPRQPSLPRQRLAAAIGDLWAAGLTIVTAPAGWGKSTLLAQVVAGQSAGVAWYRAEDVDGAASDVLARLSRAIGPLIGSADASWQSVAELLSDVGRIDRPLLLVIDDLHALEGTEADEVLGEIARAGAPAMAMLVASRIAPSWNLSRRRVEGRLGELSFDDLRFRLWEVEQLFSEHYRTPLAPADLAALARHTGGWAAGLHLFHLATRTKSPAIRRQAVAQLGFGLPRRIAEYLAENVLDELPPDLRGFLLEICVLGRVTPAIADGLRSADDSASHLGELERRQLLIRDPGDGPWLSWHEPVRTHAESVLHVSAGESVTRERYRQAGLLLELEGANADALRAYSRAEDWEAAGRLLGRKGEELSAEATEWVAWLPADLRNHDPWLLLAGARSLRAAGRWGEALNTYQRAGELMPSGAYARCRDERGALASMLGPGPTDQTTWLGALRAALRSSPLRLPGQVDKPDAPAWPLAAGLAALAAGAPARASGPLHRAAQNDRAGPAVLAAAQLALEAGIVLGGGQPRLGLVAEQLEGAQLPGLLRLVTAVGALAQVDPVTIGNVVDACRRDGDAWGEYVASTLEGWAWLAESGVARAIEALPPLERATAGFSAVGAPVLAALAASLAALAQARASNPRARSRALEAATTARAVGSPGAEAVALAAVSECDPDDGRARRDAAALAIACRIAIPGWEGREPLTGGPPGEGRTSPTDETKAATAPVELRCFGGFSLVVGGTPVDLPAIKPRARRVLRMLALDCPRAVHRETLIATIWPGVDVPTGIRNLQVAISSLRHAVEPGQGRGGYLIARDGDAYRLALPPGAWVDHIEIDRALVASMAACRSGRVEEARSAIDAALDLATAPLLPEEGPDDWVVGRRQHYQVQVALGAEAIIELLLSRGAAKEAVDVCRRAIAVDRFDDARWRQLIMACEAAGDRAAAARARRDYSKVLIELGVVTA